MLVLVRGLTDERTSLKLHHSTTGASSQGIIMTGKQMYECCEHSEEVLLTQRHQVIAPDISISSCLNMHPLKLGKQLA